MKQEYAGIGQRIYDLRVERDTQQGELAQAIGMNQSVLNRIEKGTRPARDREIRSIALYFGITTDNLLSMPQQERQEEKSKSVPAGQVLPFPEHRTEHIEENTARTQEEIELLLTFRKLDARGQETMLDAVRNQLRYAIGVPEDREEKKA